MPLKLKQEKLDLLVDYLEKPSSELDGTSAVVDFLYAKAILTSKCRGDYLKLHVKANGTPRRIGRTCDGRYYTYIDGKQVKKTRLEDLENAIARRYGGGQQPICFPDVFFEWINIKGDEDITKQTKQRYLDDYIRYFERESDVVREFVVTPFEDIDTLSLEHFIKMSIKEMQLTSKAYANLRTIIRGTFIYAKKKHYTRLSISTFFSEIALSKKVFAKHQKLSTELVFSVPEFKRIRDDIINNDRRIRSLGILFDFYTGLRPGELCTLKWTDIRKGIIYLTRTEIVYKDSDGNRIYEERPFLKGDIGYREVVLPQAAIDLLDIVKKETDTPNGDYVFMENGKRMQAQLFSQQLRRKCKALGIPVRSLNKVRKTYLTMLEQSGADHMFIQRQAGHTSYEQTTAQFYLFSNDTYSSAKSKVDRAFDQI